MTDLISKYRTRAPRYTSYPAAPHFGPIPPGAPEEALARNDGPLSVYVHVPFCRSLCWYCGCHTVIDRRRSAADPYVEDLLRELALVASRLRPGRTTAQISFGGGTPTFLTREQRTRLIDGLQRALPWQDDVDASIEIDPRTATVDDIDHLWELGFRRFSFGVQDFDQKVLEAVHRAQPAELTQRLVGRLRGLGDPVINLDLMYGLPYQTPASFTPTLDAVIALRPSRVALFHYAHVPWMKPAQKLVARHPLPDSATKAGIFDLAVQRMTAAGYERLGMDHFALPGDPLLHARSAGTLQRNFQGYTTHAGLDLIGLGVSAISSYGGVYAQNTKETSEYAERLRLGELPVERGFVMAEEDQRRKRIIMDLFCNFSAEVDPARYASELARLDPMIADGLVTIEPGRVRVTRLGEDFVRPICSVFDSYLEADMAERRYSQTA